MAGKPSGRELEKRLSVYSSGVRATIGMENRHARRLGGALLTAGIYCLAGPQAEAAIHFTADSTTVDGANPTRSINIASTTRFQIHRSSFPNSTYIQAAALTPGTAQLDATAGGQASYFPAGATIGSGTHFQSSQANLCQNSWSVSTTTTTTTLWTTSYQTTFSTTTTTSFWTTTTWTTSTAGGLISHTHLQSNLHTHVHSHVQSYQNPNTYTHQHIHTNSSVRGPFANRDGYLGIRFNTGTGTDPKYGWIHFSGSSDGKSGIVLGWAYEDSGAPIHAGEAQ